MHQQGFHSVAHGHVLRLAVHRNLHRHIQIRCLIHIDVADAIRMPQHRNTAVVHNVAHKSVASPGNNQVNEGVLLEHGRHIFPTFHQLGEVFRQTGLLRCPTKAVAQGMIGFQCFTSALQQHGIAAL